MVNLKARLTKLEAALSDQPTPFYVLCKEWQQEPASRPQIVKALGVPRAAAEYMCIVGLRHGQPKENRFPFEAWTTAELKKAVALIDTSK